MGDKFTKSLRRGDTVFGEGITKRSGKRPRFPKVEGSRWFFLTVLLFVFFLFGTARLADLQLVRGAYFKALSDGNRIRRIPVRAARGEIVDRNNKSAARNVPSYKLAEFSSGGVVVKTQDISRDTALRIQAGGESDEQGRLFTDIKREYPLSKAGAHLVGYVNEVGKDEIGQVPKDCPNSTPYILGDLVGRMGIEAQHECQLRGVDGEELIEVDTHGRLIRRLGRRDPIPGQTLKLSIDNTIQTEAYNALTSAPNLTLSVGGAKFEGGETARGALVAENPQTGEVLALVSAPSFDPSTIAQDYRSLSTDSNLPLFNRAVSGSYHPGSIFKIATSVSGLEDGKINRDFVYNDTGLIKVGSFSYSNWYFTQYGKTEGEIAIVRAIARSTDTFFYKVGEMVGADRIAFWAQSLGLGHKTGIDLPGEVNGLIPSPDWKLKTKGEHWFLGNTYHMAIGQGDVAATPLQIAQMTSVVASGGKLCSPHVGLGDWGGKGGWVCKDTGIKKETLDLVKEGMIGACSSGGTAFPFFSFQPQVACKTGTAQTVGSNTHAWFTAFGPVDNPNIVVTALLEEGGEGSRVAAPVVREVLQKWFGN